MVRHQLSQILIVFILISNLLGFAPSPVQATFPSPSSIANHGAHLVSADRDGLTLVLNTPSYTIGEQIVDGVTYQALSAPGAESRAHPGQPQIPVVSVSIGVPPDAELDLEIQDQVWHTVAGQFDLAPAPAPASLTEDLQPGAFQYQKDETLYSQDMLYPAAPARLIEEAWVRDQRIARIELFPFQYNPSQGTLIWHPQLQVRVRFGDSGLSTTRCLGDCRQPSPYEALLERALLNYDQARAWRAMPEVSTRESPYTPLNGGPYFKITIDQDGLYQLTYDDLLAAGLDPATLNPRYFHLTMQGQEVAIYIDGEGDGLFDQNDRLYFYGQKLYGDTLAEQYATWMEDWLWLCADCQLAGIFEKYTDENVYWLSVGSTFGPRMASVDGDPTGSSDPVPDHYTATVHAEESHDWFSYHFTSEDTWFWDRIQPGPASTTRTYTTTLTALATGPLTATVRAEAVSRLPNTHHTRFYLNGGAQPLDDAVWSGITDYNLEVQVPQAQLLEGVNALDFAVIYSPPTITVQDMYFNWFEIEYARQFQAMGDQLLFGHDAPGAWKYEVKELSSSMAHVFDVTQPLTPTRILTPSVTLGGGGYTASFLATPTPDAQYFVVGEGAILSPDPLVLYTPQDYSTIAGAEYVAITPAAFYTATQTLADYRAAQGKSVLIVTMEELYDQFNNGIYHPVAIKNFLAYAFDNWAIPPAYAVLVGDGHWNFKGYPEYYAPTIHMPPNLAFVDPWQGEVDSANLLATLVGDDFLPDLMIGRLPADSVAELDESIAKIIAYESAGYEDWQRRVLFVVDDVPDPAGDFEALADNLIADYLTPSPYFVGDRVYQNDYCGALNSPLGSCPQANHAITSTLNITGALLVNYIGHASVNRWTHDEIFVNADVATMDNGGQLPVVLSMTCLDGYWIHPGIPPANTLLQTSLVEELLFAQDKGAVAAFSPTGLGVATGHDHLQRGFFTAVFDDGVWELGGAAVAAKLNLFNNGWNYDLLHTFTVFGDPALQVLSPYGAALAPAIAAANGDPDTTVTYTLQLTNTGLITDTFDVTLSGNAWPTQTNPATVGPLTPGQSEALTVTVNIPALGGAWDTVEVWVASRGDPGKKARALLTTLSEANQVFLPAVRR